MFQRTQTWFSSGSQISVLIFAAIFFQVSGFAKERAVKSSLPDCPLAGGPLTWTDCYGEHTSTKGARYAGEWRGGAMHGHGVLYGSDGIRFLGTFEQNERVGKGVTYLVDGTTVTGNWNKYRLVGDVTWRWPDGKRYIGEVNQKYQRHGVGTMIWPTGEKYIGEWLDGRAEGWGIWFPQKDLASGVEGIFKDDKIYEKRALPKDFYQRTQRFFSQDL
jgi:hypothetical protein